MHFVYFHPYFHIFLSSRIQDIFFQKNKIKIDYSINSNQKLSYIIVSFVA
jgi:hypothetical protein